MFFFSGVFVFLSCVLSSRHTSASIHNNFRLTEILQKQTLSKTDIDCENDTQCQFFIKKSECIQNYCKCTDDLLLSGDGSKCLEKVQGYGSSCEDHVQCSHELSAGGICEDSTCKCKSGYHYLKGFCWKDIDLHKKCFKDEHCFSAYEYIGLKCDNGVCKCRENYYEKPNSGCRRERRTGESCNLDEDCIDGSTCEKMLCSKKEQYGIPNTKSLSNTSFGIIKDGLNCPKGMFELNNKCVLELGMSCRSDSECSHISKAYCLDGSVCGCEPATYIASENNRQCLRAARGKIEDIKSTSCKKDPECGVFGANSLCENRRCMCNNESYWEKKSFVCWPIKKLGENCVSITDCQPSVSKADCVENVCVCKVGYHPRGSVCVPDAVEVGDSCEDDFECLLDNSFCNSTKVCACKEHYYPENGKCLAGVETTCATQDDCAHLKNTECRLGNLTQNQCLCLDQHSSSDDYKYCLPIKNFKENCSETFQCTARLGNLGECRDNYCQCLHKAHYSYEKCYWSKFIGEKCSRLPECFPGNDTNSVICLKGYCSCNYDYELNENGVCVKANSGFTLKAYSTLLLSAIIFHTLR